MQTLIDEDGDRMSVGGAMSRNVCFLYQHLLHHKITGNGSSIEHTPINTVLLVFSAVLLRKTAIPLS